MARSDAYITVTCDKCDDETEIQLAALAHQGSWDERDVDKRLKRYGWKKDGDQDICRDCAE